MEYYISEDDLDKRIDVYAASLKLGLSRSQAHGLIESGDILLNDKISKPSCKLKKDDKVTIVIPEPVELKARPENIPLKVIHEDKDIIVVDKPRGMVVHPAEGNYSGTLVNALLFQCRDLSGIGGMLRPGIVHRLDKDTSGVIVVAKSDRAHSSLSRQFKAHTITKYYLALVKGRVKSDKGVISENIGRHPVHRKKMAVIKDDNKKSRRALTEYEAVERYKKHTLLRIRTLTGRTHQIRVHLHHIGHPLVGDPVYGRDEGGQMLHAELLGFEHPVSEQYAEFRAEMPEDMKKRISELKDNEGA